MQHEIKDRGDLLKPDGTVTEAGYSTHSILNYNREAIKAAPYRIKEWDFYQISNDKFCIQMTIGHTSYAGTASITVFDLHTGKRESAAKQLILPFSRLHMPGSAEKGDIVYKSHGFEMSFTHGKKERYLYCNIKDPGMIPVKADIILSQPDRSSVVVVIPFDDDPHEFYYNHKINCMSASGQVTLNGEVYNIDPENTFGLLDWGRGVWPYRHQWFWSNGSTLIDGQRFGFNLGYGFGNTSAATENMLFYDGRCHKIERVQFNIPEDSYMKPWTFNSSDKRFEMEFMPVYDNYTETKMLFVNNHCHQIFGRFNGKAVLDNGRIIEVKDMMAFAEHAVNKW